MPIYLNGHVGQVIGALADGKPRTTRETADATGLTVQQVSNALHRLRSEKLIRSRANGKPGADGRSKFTWIITADGRAALAAITPAAPAAPTPTPEGPAAMAHLTPPTTEQLDAAAADALAAAQADALAKSLTEPTGYVPLSGDVAPEPGALVRISVQIMSEDMTHNYRALQGGCTAEQARDLINEVAADAIDAAFTTKA